MKKYKKEEFGVTAPTDVNVITFWTDDFGIMVSGKESLDKVYEVFCKVIEEMKKLEEEEYG